VCGGWEATDRGQGKRCTGFESVDRLWVRCSREEHAGAAKQEDSGAGIVWRHYMGGPCKCGVTHPGARVRPASGLESKIVAEYDYEDEAGRLLFQVVRLHPKSFRQRVPDATDPRGWRWSLGDTRIVLFRLRELIAADPSQPVYIVEGEKDVLSLVKRGHVATCNPMGAGKWRRVAELARKVLFGRDVVVIADADEVGRKHALAVVASLQGAARSVTVLEPPAPHKDATDALEAGLELDALVPLTTATTDGQDDDGAHLKRAAHEPAPVPAALAAVDEEDPERAAIADEDPTDWPVPDPIDAIDLPPFPVDALCPWLRTWALAIALSMQTPVDLPACLGLTAVSMAAARVCHVQVRPDWIEPTNIWTVVALPPGEKKSPVFSEALGPVHAFVDLTHKAMAPKIAARALDRRIIAGRLKEAEALAVKYKKYEGDDAQHAAHRLQKELDAAPELRAPVLIVDDITPEALAVALEQNEERIAIFSDEGGPLAMMAGQYAKNGAPNLDVYLKSHTGGTLTVNRITRDAIILRRPLLTVGLTVQPDIVRKLSTKEGFRGRGLLARFFYSMPKTALGSREVNPPPVDPTVRAAYNEHLVTLLVQATQKLQMVMTEAADVARTAFQRELEPRLGADGDLSELTDWAGKFTGGVCRIAAVLHVGDYAASPATMPLEIPAETFERAAAIGRYFLAHAQGAFGVMGTDEAATRAQRLWAWALRKRRTTFTASDARQFLHVTSEEIGPVLAYLIGRGLLRESDLSSPTRGRPKGPSYEVNPRAIHRGK
jgi:hypothetical protein